MKKITIILAHGHYAKSVANKTIIDKLMAKYPDAVVRNIGELYPDFNIDVEAEQRNLMEAEIGRAHV